MILLEEIEATDLLYTIDVIDNQRIYIVEGINKYLPIYVWFEGERPCAMINHQVERYYDIVRLKHLVMHVYERNWLTIDHNIDWWVKLSLTPNQKWIKLFIKYGFVVEKDGKLFPHNSRSIS